MAWPKRWQCKRLKRNGRPCNAWNSGWRPNECWACIAAIPPRQ